MLNYILDILFLHVIALLNFLQMLGRLLCIIKL